MCLVVLWNSVFLNERLKEFNQVNNLAALHGLKVLVVDDSSTIRKSAEIFLSDSGCETILATDGFDAMAKIIEQHPDIIFFDIVMPRLNGYQACQLIKKTPRFKSIPIIMLSSKDGLFDKARGRLAGSNEYLTKPFTKEELFQVIQKHTL